MQFNILYNSGIEDKIIQKASKIEIDKVITVIYDCLMDGKEGIITLGVVRKKDIIFDLMMFLE